ncbi:MAG: hypothetical protein HC899_15350 [Leptolyngbyaceae cyanobacterium SM1_4_3]|nr:hypothetical protein [Leptolyngbyaceae cyanobacterium SM1_4_3]
MVARLRGLGHPGRVKGHCLKPYQTPYGIVEINRHVCQSSSSGTTLCPLEVDGRVIVTATPRFAKQISHKYAEMSSLRLVADLQENHGRSVHRSFVQTLSEAVGSNALLKEETWHYQTPKLSMPVATLSVEKSFSASAQARKPMMFVSI